MSGDCTGKFWWVDFLAERETVASPETVAYRAASNNTCIMSLPDMQRRMHDLHLSQCDRRRSREESGSAQHNGFRGLQLTAPALHKRLQICRMETFA